MEYGSFNNALYSIENFHSENKNNPDQEQSEEGVLGAVAVVGGSLLSLIGKGFAWVVSFICGCPTIMIVIFVVLAVCGLLGFINRWSYEAEEDEEFKKAKFGKIIKGFAANKNIKKEFDEMIAHNYAEYSKSIKQIENAKSYINQKLGAMNCGEIKIKYWKQDKFEGQIRKGLVKMLKNDKITKKLDAIPLYATDFVQVVATKPKNGSGLDEFLEDIAKRLSTNNLVLRVNKNKNGLVSDYFNLNLGEKLITAVKAMVKK